MLLALLQRLFFASREDRNNRTEYRRRLELTQALGEGTMSVSQQEGPKKTFWWLDLYVPRSPRNRIFKPDT